MKSAFDGLSVVEGSGRAELRRLVNTLREPLRAYTSPAGARVLPGANRATFYGEAASGMEGFARPLWPVVAATVHGEMPADLEQLHAAICAGVDPHHAEYWGRFGDVDQRVVEAAVLGWAIAAAPEAWWEPLPARSRTQLARWLEQVNHVALPANNWRFFRILINAALRRVGASWSPARWREDLDLIEASYLGDGWYADGVTTQRDYYVGMAMHFYGLLVAQLDISELADRSAQYRERARMFASDFIHWFTPDGAALPFGRSLTYRFAQGAFWSALAWSGEEALPWGVIKGIVMGHVRWWLRRPIFTDRGVLTVGYGYPNLFVSEGYNAPASPYWAMKTLIAAGLPATHPFWTADELPLPTLPAKTVQPHAGFVLRRHDDGKNVTAVSSGQYRTGRHLRNEEAKYAKFAYSTRYGFSVAVGPTTLEDGAYDNALALSEDGQYWRVRGACDEARVEGETLVSVWRPWSDVQVKTWLLFDGDWQVRVHAIQSARRLMTAEAGHSIPRPILEDEEEQSHWHCDLGRASINGPTDAAGVFDPVGDRRGEIVIPSANTNVLHPRTAMPTLRGEHATGLTWLVTLLPVSHDPATARDWRVDSVTVRSDTKSLNLRLANGRTYRFALDAAPEVQKNDR